MFRKTTWIAMGFLVGIGWGGPSARALGTEGAPGKDARSSGEFLAGVEAGVLFTNEPARGNDFLLLVSATWEANLGGLRPFVAFPFGLRAGRFIAFPRVGFAMEI